MFDLFELRSNSKEQRVQSEELRGLLKYNFTQVEVQHNFTKFQVKYNFT